MIVLELMGLGDMKQFLVQKRPMNVRDEQKATCICCLEIIMLSLFFTFLWFQSWGACALINATDVPGLLQSDSLRHGVPGKEGLRAQRSGSQEHPGCRGPGVQGRDVHGNAIIKFLKLYFYSRLQILEWLGILMSITITSLREENYQSNGLHWR